MDRRKRINRLKRIILITIAILIIVPLVCSICLGIYAYRLSNEVEDLSIQLTISQGSLQRDEDAIERLNALLTMNGNMQNQTLETVVYEGEEQTPDVSGNASFANEEEITEHKVYLTFDDGPSTHTQEILDILAQYDVKATFFVVGKDKPQFDKDYQRIVEDGHTLGMHSFSHRYGTVYGSLDTFRSDLESLQDFLYDRTGTVSKIYRFPGGSSNKVASSGAMQDMISYLDASDISYYDWNVSAGDATGKSLSASQITAQVLNGVKKFETSIVLMHDLDEKKATVKALPDIIEGLLAMENTKILPIDDKTMLVQHVTKIKE